MPKSYLPMIEEYCSSIPNLYYGTFKIFSGKVLYLSNESTHGNAHGKVKITGKTWKEVYNKVSNMSFDLNQMDKMLWIE